MLGCIILNNDVYIFFEDDEISRLEKETIIGEYINLNPPNSIGQLKVSINDNINELIKTNGNRDIQGIFNEYSLLIKERVYERLNKSGKYNSHEGFCHINLIDTENLDSHNKYMYNQLCYQRDKYSKIKDPKKR